MLTALFNTRMVARSWRGPCPSPGPSSKSSTALDRSSSASTAVARSAGPREKKAISLPETKALTTSSRRDAVAASQMRPGVNSAMSKGERRSVDGVGALSFLRFGRGFLTG